MQNWHSYQSYDNSSKKCNFLIFQHPGGDYIITENAGRDATLAFRGSRHGKDVLMFMEKFCIGILVPVSWSHLKLDLIWFDLITKSTFFLSFFSFRMKGYMMNLKVHSNAESVQSLHHHILFITIYHHLLFL